MISQKFLKKDTTYLHKKFTKVRLESNNQLRKTNKQTNKQKQLQQKQKQAKKIQQNKSKSDPLSTQLIFPKDFSQVVYLFLSQKSI